MKDGKVRGGGKEMGVREGLEMEGELGWLGNEDEGVEEVGVELI